MSSTLTRAAPNAFNTLHQIARRCKHGESLEAVVKAYENPKSVRSILSMGPSESQAVVNLVHFIPADVKEELARAAVMYGMRKGVLSHAALGCQAMRVGWGPDLAVPEWTRRMKNTPTSLRMMVDRLIGEFEDTPAPLRKTAGPAEVSRLGRICRMWEVVTAEFKAKIPDESYQKHEPGLDKLFVAQCFDDWLLAICEECPACLDFSTVPEFQSILVNLDSKMQQDCPKKT